MKAWLWFGALIAALPASHAFAGTRVSDPDPDLPSLGIEARNEVSRVPDGDWAPSRWLLVGAPSLKVATSAGLAGPTGEEDQSLRDSLGFVGLRLQAVRAFRADIRIYDNLGQFVNRLAFTVSPAEFSKLPLSADGRTRHLTVLWDNRSQDGHLVGTGSYVLKSTVSLLQRPGSPGSAASRTQYRRIGVIRGW